MGEVSSLNVVSLITVREAWPREVISADHVIHVYPHNPKYPRSSISLSSVQFKTELTETLVCHFCSLFVVSRPVILSIWYSSLYVCMCGCLYFQSKEKERKSPPYTWFRNLLPKFLLAVPMLIPCWTYFWFSFVTDAVWKTSRDLEQNIAQCPTHVPKGRPKPMPSPGCLSFKSGLCNNYILRYFFLGEKWNWGNQFPADFSENRHPQM